MYKNIINRMIEADDDAENEISKAIIKGNEIIAAGAKEAEEIRRLAIERADKRIDKIEYVEQQASQYSVDEATKRHDEIVAVHEKFYEENHERIENEIFARIIGE